MAFKFFVTDIASQCGRSLSNRAHIIGGVNTEPQLWPWMVCCFKSVTSAFEGKGKFTCPYLICYWNQLQG